MLKPKILLVTKLSSPLCKFLGTINRSFYISFDILAFEHGYSGFHPFFEISQYVIVACTNLVTLYLCKKDRFILLIFNSKLIYVYAYKNE